MAAHSYTSEQLLEQCILWRGIEPECACGECGGAGYKAYGSTSTWHGGVGGQMITGGVCDKCWGSGDAYRPWPSHRRYYQMETEIAKKRAVPSTRQP